MLQFFNGRQLRYEFHALIDDRWQLVGVTNDDRETLTGTHDFQDLEERVQRRAIAILAQPGVAGIKVLRERLRKDGSGGSAEEIFSRNNPPPSTQEPRFKDYQGDAPLCMTIDDLLRRPATRIIGTMFRPLLDQLCLCPLELLTLEGASRTVCRADDVINAVIMRVARLQSRQFGGDARERTHLLDSLVVNLRAQIKSAETTLATYKDITDINSLITAIGGKCTVKDFKFHAYRGVCLLLRGRRSPGDKLDRLIKLAATADTPESLAIIDPMLGDLIDHPLAIQDLLGPQPDLLHAINVLMHLTQRHVSSAHAPLAAMNSLLQKADLPEMVSAIYDRILRSLAGKTPLTHGDIGAEWKAVEDLVNSLIPALPQSLRLQGVSALDKRQEQLQAASFALVEND